MANNINKSYPDPLASNSEKLSNAYGLSYGRFIASQWLYDNDNSSGNYFGNRERSRYGSRRIRLEELKNYRDNTVDEDRFKDLLNVNQDVAHQAFDWTYFNLIPKFLDIVRDRFPIDIFRIDAEGLDSQTLTAKEKYREDLEDEMLSYSFTEAFYRQTGKDFRRDGFVPESEEELDVHMSNYREDQEIAIEECLTKTFDVNYSESTYNQILDDLLTYGEGVKRLTPSLSTVIETKRVEPINFIYSYDKTYTRDRRGCYYFGEVEVMRIDEIERESGRLFTKEELKAIVGTYSGILSNPQSRSLGPDDDLREFNVEVIRFCFKTTLNRTYKESYRKLTEKKDTWMPDENSRSKKIQGQYEVWMEGNYIVGTEKMWGYQIMNNMIIDSQNINRVLPPFIMYSLDEDSLVQRLRLLNDDIHTTRQKIRHLIYTARPDGNYIDVDGLMEVDLGSGGVLDGQMVLDYLYQRGDLLYSGTNLDGTKAGPPVQPMRNGISSDLQQLITDYNQTLKSMYDVTGVNEVSDGTAPTKGALVGVRQQALNATNTATKHVLMGAISIMKRSCESMVARIQNLSQLGTYQNVMKSFFGEKVYRIMQKSAPLHMFEFGITIDILPDEEDRADFKNTLETALQAGQIEMPDYLDLRSTKNLDLAKRDLKIRIEKKKRLDHQRQLEIDKNKQMASAQANVMVEQAKQQSLAMEIQANQAKLSSETQKEALLKKYDRETEIIVEQLKGRNALRLKMLEVNANKELNKFKEDRKDDRTDIQATQQSKMIDQRNKDTGAIDFKSESELRRILEQFQQAGTTLPDGSPIPQETIPGQENINQQTV